MVTGPLSAWIQELAVQHFRLEVHTCFPIIASNYNKTVLFLISQTKTLLEYSGFFLKLILPSELVEK